MNHRRLLTTAIVGAMGAAFASVPATADPSDNKSPLRLAKVGNDSGRGIRETPLGNPGGEGSGTLEGSRGFGAGMWRGTARRVIRNLLPHVPVAIYSQVRRDLARRLLLSHAAIPPARRGDGGSVGLNGLRLELLYAMGALPDAVALGKRTPLKDGLARRALLSARMLSKKARPGCQELEARLKSGAGAFTERALTVCYALSGDHFRALGAMRMLSERGVKLSRRFLTLVAAQDDPTAAKDLRLNRMDALEVALLASGKISLPKAVRRLRHPAYLRAIALSDAKPVQRRIVVAEKAYRMGALNAVEMARIYQLEEVPAARRAGALRASLSGYGPGTRAALYQAAASATDADKRLVVLAAWWRLSLAAGDWQATAALTVPLIEKFEASARHRRYAALIARVHLATGGYAAALPWFKLLRDAPFRDLRAYARLRVLMHLARGADVRLTRQDLAGWVRAQSRHNSGNPRQQVVRLHRLVLALGDAGKDQAVWQAVSGGNATPAPASDVWRGVRAIAKAKKVGETVMLTLVHLGERRLKHVPPAELHDAIRALQDVGLVHEARRLAVEAALDAGL